MKVVDFGQKLYPWCCLFKYYFVEAVFHYGPIALKRKYSAFCGYRFHTLGGKIFVILKFMSSGIALFFNTALSLPCHCAPP
jgi:hypothetical protein